MQEPQKHWILNTEETAVERKKNLANQRMAYLVTEPVPEGGKGKKLPAKEIQDDDEANSIHAYHEIIRLHRGGWEYMNLARVPLYQDT